MKIYGNTSILDRLIKAHESNRLGSSYLFWGDEGIGKEAVAVALARHINEVDTDKWMGSANIIYVYSLPPGKTSKKSDDVFETFTEEQLEKVQAEIDKKEQDLYYKMSIPNAKQIKIGLIRSLRKKLSTSISRGRKFVIISEADKMTLNASNAFLKTLEEPGENVTIILTTTNINSILPTIRSRCQPIKFSPLSDEDIISYLSDKYPNLDENDKIKIAAFAQGSIKKANEYLDENISEVSRLTVDTLRSAMIKNNYRLELIEHINTLTAFNDKNTIITSLNILANWLRDAQLLTIADDADIINVDDKESIKKFALHFGEADFDDAFNKIEQAILRVNRNVTPDLLLLDLYISLRNIFLESVKV